MAREGRVGGTSVVFPLLLISFGVLLLLWRWMPGFDPWPVLWKYWPLLLILVGAGMFLDRLNRQNHPEAPQSFPIGSAVGTLIFIAIFAFLVSRHHSFGHREWSDASSAASDTRSSKIVERGAAKAVHINIEMPTGELRIDSASGDHLLSADFLYSGSWSAPNVDYSVDSGVGQLNIGQEGGGHFIGKSDNNWNLKLAENIPIELKVDVGAGKGDLRLAKVDLTRLEVNIGAGQAFVDLTGERAKDLHAEIHGGVGEAIVKLPKNIGVVANVHGGLGSVDVHGLRSEDDGQYVNDAYGKAPNTIHLTVEGGIGHIKLEQE